MSVLAAFWAVSLLFVITPGADWAYAISAGMRGRWVMPAVAGMLSGHFLVTLIVAAGVGSLIAGHPLALTLLTLAGCVYLLWLGGNLLLARRCRRPGRAARGVGSRWALKGFCVSGLNPRCSCCSWRCCRSSPTRSRAGRCRCRSCCWGWCTCAVRWWSTDGGVWRQGGAAPAGAAQVVGRVSGMAMITWPWVD
jgi:hypothetical protein